MVTKETVLRDWPAMGQGWGTHYVVHGFTGIPCPMWVTIGL